MELRKVSSGAVLGFFQGTLPVNLSSPPSPVSRVSVVSGSARPDEMRSGFQDASPEEIPGRDLVVFFVPGPKRVAAY